MLSRNPVWGQRVGGHPKEISFEQVTVTGFLRIRTAEEAGKIRSRTDMPQRAFETRVEDQEIFPDAAERLVLNYRAAIVDNSYSWYTELKYCRSYIDARSLMDLLAAFVSMSIVPRSIRKMCPRPSSKHVA